MILHLPLAPPQAASWRDLNLGGRDPRGNTLGVNTFYLTRNGKPFFLISGEFHYSRYPERFWEQELLKIKAGGINTVASYVLWMCHEEEQGSFDWRGDNNLRHFVELCARHELNFVLRIGPFSHAEFRNGGLPDWLYGQPFEVRSNDPGYLECVERFYTAIDQQVRGLFFADGGPIIAVQIENEYMHSSAPWELEPYGKTEWIPSGRDGVAHLRVLKEMAQRLGLSAPYYFVTAWGGAPIIEDETLPVYSEYAYPTWVDTPAPSAYYLFRDKHASPVDVPSHRTRQYPVMMAEQQGGIQVRYTNRPIVPARSTEAMSIVNLGDGSNVLGYYMLHGGTTPRGRSGFRNERNHPQLSYDFQAPLGEFGQVRDSYRGLKLIHLFLDAYGETLAPLQTCLPTDAGALLPGDLAPLRYCARTDGHSGFLFVNNFQDHADSREHPDVSFALTNRASQVTIPAAASLTIPRDASFILPFEQELHGAHLHYATVQPLTRLTTPAYEHYFYFAPDGIAPEYCFAAHTLTQLHGDMESSDTRANQVRVRPCVGRSSSFGFTTLTGRHVVVSTFTRAEAEDTWKGDAWGEPRVLVAHAPLIFDEQTVTLFPRDAERAELTIFPPLTTDLQAHGAQVESEAFAEYTRLQLTLPTRSIAITVQQVAPNKYTVQFAPDALTDLSDLFLRVDYEGDTALAFLDGKLIADDFCNGLPWEIGLKRFAPRVIERGLVLHFRPLSRGAAVNPSPGVAARFEVDGDERLIVHSITAHPEYTVRLS